MGKILYIGGFILPDKNAAAQRVISIAKGLRDLSNQVIFINYTDSIETAKKTEYFGFLCYEYPKREMVKHLTDISNEIKIIMENDIDIVIVYNYPALALSKMIKYCNNNQIRIIADVTEWYVAKGNIVFKIIKTIDTEYRMRILHRKVDGIIAISDYLYNYYRNNVNTIKIPTTVDIKEAKWNCCYPKSVSETIFVYAGQPSAQKERIDIIVDYIEELSEKQNVSFRVIGITKKQYEEIYNRLYSGSATVFLGRKSHTEVIEEVSKANWSIVIRENNKVVKAGFPTKVSESIACGTPVIANRFSDVMDYLDRTNSILCEIDDVQNAIEKACKENLSVDRTIFDYHNYLGLLKLLF